ncbi:MAG TPA: hypothetical protein PLP11_01880 [Bacteroidales bacterium]|nr:hypothetical protein [Bacteroidales bacterium]
MDYIIYTTEGYTESPNNTIIENCQIIDFIFDDNSIKEEVIDEFIQNNNLIEEWGFDKDKLKVLACIDDETLSALQQLVNYCWRDEKLHFNESSKKEQKNHIFNQISKLAYYLDKDYKILGTLE